MRTQGMTLTSVLVAVALASALAVATSKLVSNQAKLNKIMELTDQRDMIVRFYSALMHNRVVWLCTLYDSSNNILRTGITGRGGITGTSGYNGNVELRTPDCKFKENFDPGGKVGIAELNELTATHGTGDHYRSSGAFFDVHNPITLGDSLTDHNANGWWKVALTASSVAKGSIDLVLTVDFEENAYKTAHAGFDPPDIRDSIEYRVRKGEPNIDNVEKDCGTRAVVAIADLASGTRGVTCSTDPLVSVPALMSPPSGNFLHTLATGSDTRVGGGRTGLQRMVASSRAIADISFSGAYELAAIGSNLDGTPKPGVLGFVRPSSITCATTLAGDLRGQNLPALSEIAGGHPRWTHHLGPQGKQGIPGPPGYKGPQGAPGPPGTCPTTPPPCP